jgi:hypothetical protein
MSFGLTATQIAIGAVVTSTAMAGMSAYSSSKTANMSAKAKEAEAKRRYLLQSGTAKNQLEEQQGIARDKMTEITRKFALASGSMQAASGESSTGGNVRLRMSKDLALKESEAKGVVAKEVDTNSINIAQGMLADKIDTEAIIGQAKLSKQNVLLNTAGAMIGGASSGISMASGIKNLQPTKKG